MVERHHSFDEVGSDSASAEQPNKKGGRQQEPASPSALHPGKGNTEQSDDGTKTAPPEPKATNRRKMDPAGIHVNDVTLSMSSLALQDESHISSVAGDSRFDDATEITADTTVPITSPQTPSGVAWSDQETETILMDALVTEDPRNVLELRRQWPRPPIPDTRQVNRVLYKLRDEGQILQCPSNGTNKKPCWKLLVA